MTSCSKEEFSKDVLDEFYSKAKKSSFRESKNSELKIKAYREKNGLELATK